MRRLVRDLAALAAGLVLGGVVVSAFAQSLPDPCMAVREQLAQYAVAVANLQVALTQAKEQAGVAKPGEKK